MQYADAAAAAKLINTIFQPEDISVAGGAGQACGSSRRIAPLRAFPASARQDYGRGGDRTNSLVVTPRQPETMKVIDQILKVLDSDPAAMAEVKVFVLKYAQSASTAKLITTIFAPEGSLGPHGQPVAQARRAGPLPSSRTRRHDHPWRASERRLRRSHQYSGRHRPG